VLFAHAKRSIESDWALVMLASRRCTLRRTPEAFTDFKEY
jgi:hypothetical protein